MSRPSTPRDRFAEAGYRVEVQFVAGPAALSRLGVLQRLQSQVDELGYGAYCAVPIQERNYVGVLETAGMLDRTVCTDRVAVSRRGGKLLYEQQRVEGPWRPHAGSREAIQNERERTWTLPEQEWFVEAARTMAARLGPAYTRDLLDACRPARPLFTSTTLPALDRLIDKVAARAAQITAANALERSPAQSTDARTTNAPPMERDTRAPRRQRPTDGIDRGRQRGC
jgi:UDP-N-acetylglucosamine kinase